MKERFKKLFDETEAVLFDLDGTLVDSMWMWKEIDVEYLGRFGIPYEEGLQQAIEGMSFTETAQYIKDHFQIPDSVEQMKSDWNDMAYDKYCHEVPLKPGAKLFLDTMKAMGIKVGIGTSNSRELVSAVVRALGIEEDIDIIVTGCDVEHGKPAPDVYLKAAEHLGAVPSKCIVFEDIVPGIEAGKAAGMTVISIDDLYSEDVLEEKKKRSDYHISDYRDFFLLEEE